MLKVDWVDDGPIPVPKAKDLAALCAKVLRAELPKGAQKGSVNLIFCSDAHVRSLNKRFRKLDKVTDVLSFNFDGDDEDGIFGEIYIATRKAKSQAPRWKNSFSAELRRLVVHGALHLAGFDHMHARERAVMRVQEDRYLTPK